MFWSNGYAWGTCTQTPRRGRVRTKLTVLHGALDLKRIKLTGVGAAELRRPRVITRGRSAIVHIPKS